MDHATQVAHIKKAFEYIDGDRAATPPSCAMEEILIGQNEPALAHFHQSLERAMTGE